MMRKVYFDRRYIELEEGDAYDAFRSMFREVNAAGGLVRGYDGRLLMIRRNGIWDLPKGHQEDGEAIETCALREVEEETSVTGLSLGSLICVTEHCYFRDGKWFLKHTWWYDMGCAECGTKPQTEEGISEVAWVSENEAKEYIKDSYASIVDVLSTKFHFK